MRSSFASFLVSGSLALVLSLGACGGSSHTVPEGDGGGPDAAAPSTDGGSGRTDAGLTPYDSGGLGDAGTSVDSGTTTPVDSGTITPPLDGGPMPTIPGSVGAACAADSDCDMLTAPTCMTTLGGAGGFSAEFPGGYCTQTCTPSFGGAPDGCPAGSACFGGGFGGFGAAFCGKTCSSDADCRVAESYSCTAPPFGAGPSVCAPPLGGGGGGGGMGRDSGLPFP